MRRPYHCRRMHVHVDRSGNPFHPSLDHSNPPSQDASTNTVARLGYPSGNYEHIIRNEEALNRIREYIMTNPLRWHLDRENVLATGTDPTDRE